MAAVTRNGSVRYRRPVTRDGTWGYGPLPWVLLEASPGTQGGSALWCAQGFTAWIMYLFCERWNGTLPQKTQTNAT